jgi:dephospho-CoA kinase
MLQVGITGGMGTGKSTVCKIFASFGIPVLNMDALAKQIIQSNQNIQQQLQQQFGADIISNGILDKKLLAQRAFINADTTKKINTIVHPQVLLEAKQWHLQQNSAYTIQESALSIESGSYKQLDCLIGVTSPMHIRLNRIIHRDNCTEAQAMDRIKLQLPEEEKLAFYRYTIYNEPHQLLIPQVLHIHQQLLLAAKQQ